MGNLFKRVTVSAALLLSAACTTSQSEVPALAGPSEFALSIRLTATPDSISQDGASQSAVLVNAFDATGRPMPGLALRIDMAVGGSVQDFGTLSARTIVTGTDGRATTVYTAPPAPPPAAGGSGSVVTIVATPTRSDFQTANPQFATIRLVPPGIILPPAGSPTARFVVSPTPLTVNVPAIFDGSTSSAGTGSNSIVSYDWDFGDGTLASGKTVSHAFTSINTFNVTLTVRNDRGLSASATQTVTPVNSTSAGLIADFKFSPDKAVPNQPVLFDASVSTVPPGDSITDYSWSFGDVPDVIHTSSPLIQHTYFVASNGQFNVVLTITDRFGNKSTKTLPIAVTGVGTPALAAFTASPNPVTVGTPVTFDASASGPGAGGGNVVNYQWDFGDGTTGTGVSAIHTYATAGPKTVALTVTTSLGNTGSVTRTVIVN